jgi:hypothetical protein
MTGLLRRLLAGKAIPITTCVADGQWGEIDSPGDVALYEKMLLAGELVLEDGVSTQELARY